MLLSIDTANPFAIGTFSILLRLGGKMRIAFVIVQLNSAGV